MLDMYFLARFKNRRRLPPTVTAPNTITQRRIQTVKDMKDEILDQMRANSLQTAVPYTPGFVVTPVISLEE